MKPSFSRRRVFEVLLGTGVFCAVVGFFLEVNRAAPHALGYAADAPRVEATKSAQSYAELRNSRSGSDSNVYLATRSLLRRNLPKPTDPVKRQPGDRERALAQRAERRAFDGAPPRVPHPIDQRAAPNCLVCHEHGAKIGELVAPKMGHQPLSSCTQCHVPGRASLPGAIASSQTLSEVPNDFEPLPFGGLGERAFVGAPPSMPHGSWMRTQCDSCHGVTGKIGFRTSHPERQVCEQCHAPEAALDQTRAMFSPREGQQP